MELANTSLIFFILTLVIFIFVGWVKHIKYRYWTRRGLLNPAPIFFLGNIMPAFPKIDNVGDIYLHIYKYLQSKNQKHGGIYLLLEPIYIPVDLEIVKRILLTDFHNFTDRGIYYNETEDPLSANLFCLEGARWKKLRAKLTPTFTTGKLRMMTETVKKCTDHMLEYLEKHNNDRIEITNLFSCFTTDVIGSCAFGIECNSFKDEQGEFKTEANKFFRKTIFERLVALLTYVVPNLMKKLKVKSLDSTSTNFFMKVIQTTVDYREKNNIKRKDFMELLLQLKNHGKLVKTAEDDHDSNNSNDWITFNELAAQAYVFFVAGYETSSTALSYCLYELALNMDIQNKVVREIKEKLAKYNNQITFDAVKEMTYLEQVFNETLRKYPPIPILNRITQNDYKIYGTDVTLEKGTKIMIPVLGIHRDPKLYPNPDQFNPDRFSEDNKFKIQPYSFLPFGEGPRTCIGLRFGVLQAKMALIALLNTYQVVLCESTSLTPLKADPNSWSYSISGEVYIKIKKHSFAGID